MTKTEKAGFFKKAEEQLPEALDALSRELAGPKPGIGEFKEELRAAKEALAPQLEGFQDLSMLNLRQESKQQIAKDLVTARRLDTLLVDAMNALTALQEAGYPDLPVIEIQAIIYADLAEQVETMQAALKRYTPISEAVGGRVIIEG